MACLLRRQKVVELCEELFPVELAKPNPEETPSLLDSTTDTWSIDSGSSDTESVYELVSQEGRWSKPYEAPPVVNQSTIILLGVFIFVLAILWPPLILLLTYLTSKLISYSYRVNDDASNRRKLFAEFARDEEQPLKFRSIPDHIELKESYWVNQR